MKNQRVLCSCTRCHIATLLYMTEEMSEQVQFCPMCGAKKIYVQLTAILDAAKED